VAADTHRNASAEGPALKRGSGLYTAEERQRRDATPWTLVQGVLAPVQFLVFLISTVLVVRFLVTGAGEGAAIASILLKTFLLYTIMVTGSIWEKVVFGKWLFAEPFWWEDLVSFLVIGLHTLYLAALLKGWWSTEVRMGLALVAYAIYAVNATQFLLKLRAARLQAASESLPATGAAA
jgi:3-vinyl bacteriochlorophyllide hydratase